MSQPVDILNSDYYQRIDRLIAILRAIPGWRDHARLKEANSWLVDARKRAERHHAALAFRSRCNPTLGPGCVAMYSTISGKPPTHRNSYERRSQSNLLPLTTLNAGERHTTRPQVTQTPNHFTERRS
jgi:hypothetical protein